MKRKFYNSGKWKLCSLEWENNILKEDSNDKSLYITRLEAEVKELKATNTLIRTDIEKYVDEFNRMAEEIEELNDKIRFEQLLTGLYEREVKRIYKHGSFEKG